MADAWDELKSELLAGLDNNRNAMKANIEAKIEEAKNSELMEGITQLADSLTSIQTLLQDLRSRVTVIEAKLTEEE